MNHIRKKAAIEKHFSALYNSLDEMRAGIKTDEKAYTEDEVEEIVEGIRQKAEEASKPGVDTSLELTEEEKEVIRQRRAGITAVKPTMDQQYSSEMAPASPYAWFDIFYIDPVVREFRDPSDGAKKSVITKFELGKKVKSVLIEPHLVTGFADHPGFNHYAIGVDKGHGGSPGQLYLPKDKYKNGDNVSYLVVAEFLKLDPFDANLLLLKKYPQLLQS